MADFHIRHPSQYAGVLVGMIEIEQSRVIQAHTLVLLYCLLLFSLSFRSLALTSANCDGLSVLEAGGGGGIELTPGDIVEDQYSYQPIALSSSILSPNHLLATSHLLAHHR